MDAATIEQPMMMEEQEPALKLEDLGYFANQKPEETGKLLWERVMQYYDGLQAGGYMARMMRSYDAYYGSTKCENSTGEFFSSSKITRSGEKGESFNIKINQYRNILQHLLVLATSNRTAYEAVAENTDHQAMAQAILAEGLLENYDSEKRVERQKVRVAEFSLFLGYGHLANTWDTDAGKEYRLNSNGSMVFEGDLAFNAYTPLDVIEDLNVSDRENSRWKCVRRSENKYDLMAKLPELRDQIEGINEASDKLNKFRFMNVDSVKMDCDDVPVFDFYHKKTASVPEGRMMTILPGGTPIFDGPLGYDGIPLILFQPYNIEGTPYGYTPGFDLLAIQDGIDLLASTIITNQIAFGKQLIWMPKGHEVNYQELAQGLAVIQTDPKVGKPEAMALTKTAPEIFGFIKDLIQFAEQIAGLNSVVRGNPEGQLKGASGSAMALLAAQAIQFSNGFVREWEYFNEDTGTMSVKNLQTYAQTPRIAQVVGKSKRQYIREFSGEKIAQVTRVRVKTASAVSKTASGKMTIADNLLDKQAVTADQYLKFTETGKLEALTEAPLTKRMLIDLENENLQEGMDQPVLRSDDHQAHIQEHLSLLDDPTVRQDAKIMNAVLEHVSIHEMWANGGPQPPMPGMDQGGGQMGAPGQPMPQDQAQAPMGAEDMGGQMPNMPNMPDAPPGTPEELAGSIGDFEYQPDLS